MLLRGFFCFSTGGGEDIECDGDSLRLSLLESEEIELDELSDRTDVRGSVGDGPLVVLCDDLFLLSE